MKVPYRVIVSGVIGNTLENYDYILYANFAFIFSKLFFPTGDLYTSLIATFGVFAAGFLTRPIGALIFGHIGDKHSRKTALSVSIMLMSFPTSLIGLLPSYSEIGILAPIALVIIRMMQGLSIGGETSSFMIYLMESMPNKNNKALFGSIALSSTALGLFLGLLASFICNVYFSDVDWAWRIPFLLSFPVGIIGFYIRSKLDETTEFKNLKKKNLIAKSPFIELIKNYKIRFTIICGLFISISIPFYIFFGFLTTFLVKVQNLSPSQVSIIFLTCSAIFIISPLLSGILSDRFGTYKVLLSAMIAFTICIFPIFKLILSQNFASTFIGCAFFILLISLYQGSIPSLVKDFFPAKVRSIGTALSFNLVSVVFGGFSPLILTWLLKITNTGFSIPSYLVIFSFITIISLTFSRKHKIL